MRDASMERHYARPRIVVSREDAIRSHEAMKTRQKIRLDAFDQRIGNLERRGNEEWTS
ncbi:MAG: hypothetical protein WC382_04305 [Methanoregulaceae archaeon]